MHKQDSALNNLKILYATKPNQPTFNIKRLTWFLRSEGHRMIKSQHEISLTSFL